MHSAIDDTEMLDYNRESLLLHESTVLAKSNMDARKRTPSQMIHKMHENTPNSFMKLTSNSNAQSIRLSNQL